MRSLVKSGRCFGLGAPAAARLRVLGFLVAFLSTADLRAQQAGADRGASLWNARFWSGVSALYYSGDCRVPPVDNTQGPVCGIQTFANPISDTAKRVYAEVGEIGFAGEGTLYEQAGFGSLGFSFDGGLKQFLTQGFVIGSYRPTQYDARMELDYRRQWGVNRFAGAVRTRSWGVNDPTPQPMYIEPGYDELAGTVALYRPFGSGKRLGVTAEAYEFDYAPTVYRYLDLLDRSGAGLTVDFGGFQPGAGRMDAVVSFKYNRYPLQKNGIGANFRVDRVYGARLQWDLSRAQNDDTYWHLGSLMLQLNGTLNRSNSRRPEYRAVSMEGMMSLYMGGDTEWYVYGRFVAKRYDRGQIGHVILVAGEEADQASIAVVQLNRLLPWNDFQARIRAEWKRSEYHYGSSHYQRLGLSVSLHYHPRF